MPLFQDFRINGRDGRDFARVGDRGGGGIVNFFGRIGLFLFAIVGDVA